jgi:hypothetical protein
MLAASEDNVLFAATENFVSGYRGNGMRGICTSLLYRNEFHAKLGSLILGFGIGMVPAGGCQSDDRTIHSPSLSAYPK